VSASMKVPPRGNKSETRGSVSNLDWGPLLFVPANIAVVDDRGGSP